MICEGLEAFGIVVDSKKNEANARTISSGKVKLLVIPTNEELAIARDTRRLLQDAERREEVFPVPAPPVPATDGFGPPEVAKLVVLWARNPKADAASLARRWGQVIGRTVQPREGRRELERLSLTPSARPPGRAT